MNVLEHDQPALYYKAVSIWHPSSDRRAVQPRRDSCEPTGILTCGPITLLLGQQGIDRQTASMLGGGEPLYKYNIKVLVVDL